MKAIVLIAVLFATSLVAGEASVQGFVALNAVASLPGVTIGLDNLGHGTHFEATTDGSGYYQFPEVTPGAYSIFADAKGYGCILIPHLAVHYGEQVRQDFNFVRGRAYDGCDVENKKKSK